MALSHHCCQVKVVATAFDKDSNVLIRWQSVRQAGSATTVAIGTAKGIHGDIEVVAKKDDLQKWLELEGYSVSDGEWTKDDIDRLVTRRAESRRAT